MRILVAGAVGWTDREAIHRELSCCPEATHIITGDAPGADALAEEVGQGHGFSVQRMHKHKRDDERCRGAWKGLNERMLAQGPDRVLIFHPAIEKSRGSKHMGKIAEAAGVEVQVFSG